MAKKAFYDGKKLFEVYHGMGAAASLDKVMEWAKQNSPSPETGGASRVGVRAAMWRWACRNPKESYEIWRKYHFERYPFADIPTVEEYVKEVLVRTAHNNPGIMSEGDIEKLLMQFGLSTNVAVKVKKNDVIQIVDRELAGPTGMRGGMYGRLLIVNDVLPDEGFVVARMFDRDDTFSNHQLKYGQFGVVGRSIIV